MLDQDLDLRTVKYSIWKSSGDIRLYYREIDPLPKTDADNGESNKTADSEEGREEKQEENQEVDKTASEEAPEAEEESGDGGREQGMETEEQLVAVMDGEEEEGSEEKMEDSRTEEKS